MTVLHKGMMILLVPVVAIVLALPADAPKPLPPLPTHPQLDWQRCETTMFLHFGVNTFTGREWGEGKENPIIFNPTRLDARQWVRAARAGGFKIVILTAKHHDGFCLWPSKYTEHSVKNSPWRGGKGDVVKELAEACREAGLKLGIYLSPWDRHEKSYGDSPKYNEHYRNQLTELMAGYGPIAEVWFDGACGEGPNGKRQEYDWESYRAVVRKYQPDAVMFSDAGPDIRWIGNEKGFAGDPCWSTIDPAAVPYPGAPGKAIIDTLQHGTRGGAIWRPGECDVSIRPGWFWHRKEDAKVRQVENLIDLYFKSVGRNSLLLLNVPPNDQGLLSQPDVQRLVEFRQALNRIFQTDLAGHKRAVASNTRGGDRAYGPARALDGDANTYWATDDKVTSAWLEVDLGKPTQFNISNVQEAISLGQRVEVYHLECWDGSAWKTISTGTTIGHKKLDRFEKLTAQHVRLVIDKALACPTIATFGLYLAN